MVYCLVFRVIKVAVFLAKMVKIFEDLKGDRWSGMRTMDMSWGVYRFMWVGNLWFRVVR